MYSTSNLLVSVINVDIYIYESGNRTSLIRIPLLGQMTKVVTLMLAVYFPSSLLWKKKGDG